MSKNRFPSPYGFTISVWLAVKIDAILFEACCSCIFLVVGSFAKRDFKTFSLTGRKQGKVKLRLF